ncbi:MAG: serine/threonine protein kinase, partial [Chloroflexi bacterium]
MADRVGQQLGNYRMVRLLGQGGFAEVYLGEHVYLGTPAAIKVLHTLIASDNTEH